MYPHPHPPSRVYLFWTCTAGTLQILPTLTMRDCRQVSAVAVSASGTSVCGTVRCEDKAGRCCQDPMSTWRLAGQELTCAFWKQRGETGPVKGQNKRARAASHAPFLRSWRWVNFSECQHCCRNLAFTAHLFCTKAGTPHSHCTTQGIRHPYFLDPSPPLLKKQNKFQCVQHQTNPRFSAPVQEHLPPPLPKENVTSRWGVLHLIQQAVLTTQNSSQIGHSQPPVGTTVNRATFSPACMCVCLFSSTWTAAAQGMHHPKSIHNLWTGKRFGGWTSCRFNLEPYTGG